MEILVILQIEKMKKRKWTIFIKLYFSINFHSGHKQFLLKKASAIFLIKFIFSHIIKLILNFHFACDCDIIASGQFAANNLEAKTGKHEHEQDQQDCNQKDFTKPLAQLHNNTTNVGDQRVDAERTLIN
jgi:hypothetical protein